MLYHRMIKNLIRYAKGCVSFTRKTSGTVLGLQCGV